jgi:hypothetical protein
MDASKLLSVILIVTSMTVSSSAQEEPSRKKGKLEIGSGINVLGPAPQMAELMEVYGFDRAYNNWLFGGTSEHPHYSPIGLSFQISYSRNLGPRSHLGILLHYSGLRQVDGYTYIDKFLKVLFSNVYLVPLYTLNLGQSWEIQAGPALMINSTKSIYSGNSKRDTKAGLLFGLNLKIWDNTLTYGKISTQYLLTMRDETGPYTVEAWRGGDTATIPESKIGFSHLNILFVFGVHL